MRALTRRAELLVCGSRTCDSQWVPAATECLRAATGSTMCNAVPPQDPRRLGGSGAESGAGVSEGGSIQRRGFSCEADSLRAQCTAVQAPSPYARLILYVVIGAGSLRLVKISTEVPGETSSRAVGPRLRVSMYWGTSRSLRMGGS